MCTPLTSLAATGRGSGVSQHPFFTAVSAESCCFASGAGRTASVLLSEHWGPDCRAGLAKGGVQGSCLWWAY